MIKYIASHIEFWIAVFYWAIKRCIVGFRIWIDKQRRCGDARIMQHAFGRFRVVYPDGERSTPFDYRTAKGYASIFGGNVIHIKTNRIVS